jgi:hypothetical protein
MAKQQEGDINVGQMLPLSFDPIFARHTMTFFHPGPSVFLLLLVHTVMAAPYPRYEPGMLYLYDKAIALGM